MTVLLNGTETQSILPQFEYEMPRITPAIITELETHG
jgi:hypothetical protein